MKNRLLMLKRLSRLQKLLSRLNNGDDVQRRDIQSVLTPSEWEEFNSLWTEEKSNRNHTPPKELVHYIKLKKSVALANARYTRYVQRSGNKMSAKKSKELAEIADNDQDKLLDYLREQISHKRSLVMWLVPIEPYDSVEDTLDAGILPQVCTSRTVASEKRTALVIRSKRDLKIQILEQAIANIENINSPKQEEWVSVAKTTKKRDFTGFKV